jgi:uncharacterized protein
MWEFGDPSAGRRSWHEACTVTAEAARAMGSLAASEVSAMNAPTYNLRQSDSHAGSYLAAVRELADWVTTSGESLRPVVAAYTEFVQCSGREAERSYPEYLLELLLLGVMWRTRGKEAQDPSERRRALVTELVRERRNGAGKRRDGTTAELVSIDGSVKRGRIDPTLHEIRMLLDWMLASGEYDDELARLEGQMALLSSTEPATNREILRLVVAFAVRFEAKAERCLGPYTHGVERFLTKELVSRERREDTLQCSRRRVEYHLNMVGAEILNRAWRSSFLDCRRHVVILPGCARVRLGESCRAVRKQSEQSCTHCTLGCAVSAATRLAERMGAAAITVLHGSDFARFLDSAVLSGPDVGIIGVACAAGLLGAGWRARAQGFHAQCVLLNASGCEHWQPVASTTSFDIAELARILDRGLVQERTAVTPRVA